MCRWSNEVLRLPDHFLGTVTEAMDSGALCPIVGSYPEGATLSIGDFRIVTHGCQEGSATAQRCPTWCKIPPEPPPPLVVGLSALLPTLPGSRALALGAGESLRRRVLGCKYTTPQQARDQLLYRTFTCGRGWVCTSTRLRRLRWDCYSPSGGVAQCRCPGGSLSLTILEPQAEQL